jgi:DNA-binding CsgD family transcriptional regulator
VPEPRANAPAPLLERGSEIDEIGRQLEAASQGSGGVLVIEGPAGIGKTRLLWETRRLAAAAGYRTLGARCDELESSVPYGLASQLLTAPLLRASSGERDELLEGAARLAAPLLLADQPTEPLPPIGDPGQALVGGLTWLVANLAARRPLVMLIDDGHWADEESLRWLNQLEKRIDELSVLVALTVRRGEAVPAGELIERLTASATATALTPPPLSENATAELLSARLDDAPSQGLTRSAHSVTGGNPLLLDALALELLAEQAGTGARAAALAERLAPESLARTVLLRLRRLPETARPVAEALTILGQAPAQVVIELCGSPEDEAELGIEALEAAELILAEEEIRFTHPIIRSTIYEQVSPRRRHRRHAQAALLLHGRGESPERIAPHLIAAGGAEIPGGAEILFEAGRRVYSLGAPAATVRYLLRALELHPEPGMRGEILLQLGAAAIRALDATAVEHLERAVEEAADSAQRRTALMELARAQLAVLDLPAASTTFETALAESTGDRELELSAEAELASARLNLREFDQAAKRIRGLRKGLAGATAAERKLLAVAAFAAAQSNEPATEVHELARAAFGDGALVEEQSAASVIVIEALMATVMTEGHDLAGPALDGAIADARERGWPIGFAMASTLRAWMRLRAGDLAAAGADASAADDVRALHGATPLDPIVAAFLVELQREAGHPEEADRLIADRCPDQVPEAAVFQLLLYGRGRLRLAQGEIESGVADILLAGERELAFGGTTPAALDWRSTAAVALASLGDGARAGKLAREELELAQALGTDRAIGIALRAVALTGAESKAVAGLQTAAEHLGRSRARLEHARTLIDLGATVRRRGSPRESREPLRRALAIAVECGAVALERRAGEELGATGERQRTTDSDGVDALTPSELRAARMAAEGRSNRQIAQDLFVTTRTIEVHLTRTYRKLGIRSRRELAGALDGSEPPPG